MQAQNRGRSGSTALRESMHSSSIAGMPAGAHDMRRAGRASAPRFTGSVPMAIQALLRCLVLGLLACLLMSAARAQTTSISGTVNTYYPGTGSPIAGATSLTVGAASTGAAHALTACDQVLVIQMIDATINTSNSTAYGSGGSAASGYTALNSSGVYEFATIASVSGSTITFTAGLQNSYRGSGASVYQVVYVPNYPSATLTGTVTPAQWTGATGGVVALQVQGALGMGGQTISAGPISATAGTGYGFSGGKGSDAYYSANVNNYVVLSSSSTATSRYGEKGQGIAGIASSYDSYWSGSRARGAPANGGGGGVDVNSGGGGGGNGGAGGMGGGTWPGAGSQPYGGFGGSAIDDAGFTRVFMGGGGGGGQQNNSSTTGSKGGDGGGIVLIRAGSISGSGTIDVSGGDGQETSRGDGGGGGGAGGTILVGVQSGSLAGLTLKANGGAGGVVGNSGEGAGGGGAGGRVIANASGATVSTTGGTASTNSIFANSNGVAGASGVSTSSAIVGAPSAPPTCMRLSKALGSARRSTTDQFTVRILSGTTVVNATVNSTTTGTGATVTAGTGTTGVVAVTPAATYTLTEAAAGTTTLFNYLASISCTNAKSGSATTLPSGSSPSASFSVTPATGDNISCTLTNTNTATLTLQKALGGTGRIDATDQFALSATGTGAPAAANTTGTGTTVTSAAYAFQATPGTAYVLDESMATGSASTLAQYSRAVACTNTGPTNVSSLNSLPINVTPAVGDSISCTITNTPKPPTLTLQKALGGTGRVVASDQFALSIKGSGTPVSVNTTGTGTAITSAANTVTATPGTAYTLDEAMATGSGSSLSAYTRSVTCSNTGPTSVSALTTLPVSVTPAVGDAISCLITNTPAAATVSGRVFLDNGTGSGVANDGILNGSEAPQAGIAVRLTDCAATPTVYASALTDGTGGYSFAVPTSVAVNAPLCVEQTNRSAARISTGASVGATALPSGTATAATGGSYTYTRGGTPDRIAFAWNGTGHANLNFGDVDNSGFAASSAKTAQPGSTVTYAHTFSAGTAGQVRFGIASETATPALAGWSTQVFADPGCTGSLQPGAAQLYPPAGTGTAVAAGGKVCIVVKQFVPASAPQGANDKVTIRADFDYGNANPALSGSYVLDDITTVSDSVLELRKEVRNVTQGVTSFGVNNQAKSGDTLEYRITYTNNGAAPIGNMVVNDATPGYTSFVSATTGTTPATLTGCTKRTPANVAPNPAVACAAAQSAGGTGPIGWTFAGSVAPGGTGTVLFQVKID